MDEIDVDMLRTRTIAELAPADTLVRPALGMGYYARQDGTIQSAMVFAPLMGTVFTITAIDGTHVTAVDAQGREITQDAGDIRRQELILLH